LFSSGKGYMQYAAKVAGRTHLEDKIEMAIMASISFYGAFHHELSSWYSYIVVSPLLVHLLRIAYLSHKFKHKK